MKENKMIQSMVNILIFSVFIYFIWGQFCFESDRPVMECFCEEYSGTWERIMEDGTRSEIEIPGTCEVQRNETILLENRLPEEIGHDSCLCFRSAKQDMKFYIDGELRQEYSTKDKRLFGKMSAVAYVFVNIDEEDAGKTLQVEACTDSSFSGIFYPVYYGNPMGIWRFFFQQYGLELIVSFITFILSAVVIIASITFRIYYHRRIPLEYLGWGILIAAVWLITNSNFRQLIFPNLTLVNDMTFIMIMLLALPYLLYMDAIQKGRYQKGYKVLEIMVLFNFFLCCGLHMMGIWDYSDSIGYVSFFCVLSIIWLILTIGIDIIKKRIKDYLFVAIGTFCVCVAAFMQIVFYFQRVKSFNGVILSIGLIMLLVFSTINTIYEIVQMDREKQQAVMASESKGRFLANMSHEIRTPIHAILGMDEMILREGKDEKIKEYALDIQSAGQTLLALINDILDISKIESGKLEIIPVDYDFSSLIHDVVNMMEIRARDKDLEFYVSIDETIPSRLYGDDVRLRQILVNLIGNGIKYTEEGCVTFKVEAKQEDEYADIHFVIEDTGIGIQEEDMEKLFREFERIEEKRNRNVEGTGLGMSISNKLLDMMGSQLEVQSVYGQGSTFSFTVRQKIMSEEPVGNLENRIIGRVQQDIEYQVLFTAPFAKILVVDDNSVNRKVLMNLLSATEVIVDEAASGMQCLEYVKEVKYDIIFMDHMMPEMDGIETLHQMKEMGDYLNKDTPVIALTANAVTGAREMYLKEGFCDFLSKPVHPEKMEKMIMDLLPKEKINQESAKKINPNKTSGEKHMEFSDVEGIDWSYGKSHCKTDKILMDTTKQFYDMMDMEGKQLEQYFEGFINAGDNQEEVQKNLSAYRIKVHSMKSASAMIGAVSLFGVARVLEGAARDNRLEEIKAIMPYFMEEWENMRNRLSLLFETENEEKCPLEFDVCEEILKNLPGAMEDMDVDAADEMIDRLKQFEFPDDNMTQIFDKLCQAVMDLEEDVTRQYCELLREDINIFLKEE